MESTSAATPNIIQDLLPIQNYLVDWHVRVTWIAFMTLWVFWGLAWFIRNAFGGDNGNVIQSNAQISHDPHVVRDVNGGIVDPETGINTTTAGTTTTTTGVATTHHNKHTALGAPAWSVNVFVSKNKKGFFIMLFIFLS